MKISESKVFMGKFWVGDPCYVFPDKRWNEFCRVTKEANKAAGSYREPAFFEDGGATFFVAPTAYGDGAYPISVSRNVIGHCGVDAGLLSLIPLSLIKKWKDEDSKSDATLGLIVEVSGVPVGDGEGNWKCGALSVKTSFDDEEYEERILSICAKCSDLFSARFDGKEYDGYVPSWFPSPGVEHFGDYVELEIDIETGRIVNWKKPTKRQLNETFKTNLTTSEHLL